MLSRSRWLETHSSSHRLTEGSIARPNSCLSHQLLGLAGSAASHQACSGGGSRSGVLASSSLASSSRCARVRRVCRSSCARCVWASVTAAGKSPAGMCDVAVPTTSRKKVSSSAAMTSSGTLPSRSSRRRSRPVLAAAHARVTASNWNQFSAVNTNRIVHVAPTSALSAATWATTFASPLFSVHSMRATLQPCTALRTAAISSPRIRTISFGASPVAPSLVNTLVANADAKSLSVVASSTNSSSLGRSCSSSCSTSLATWSANGMRTIRCDGLLLSSGDSAA